MVSDITYLQETFKEIDKIRELYDWREECPRITPKPFIVEKISETGAKILNFERGSEQTFSGTFFAPLGPGSLKRVLFHPLGIHVNGETYFMEIKGYGADGGNLGLVYHDDGDALFGMFYKNAKKEYNILNKASINGISVPKPLLAGKFDREVIVNSGLRNYADLTTLRKDCHNKKAINKRYKELKKNYDKGLESLESCLKKMLPVYWPISEDPIAILNQPYNLGIVVRGAKSPIRLGDPSRKYAFTEQNIKIAKSCGKAFIQLIDLGYFHLSPSTGNWTLAGELTDMADCYDLKKDKNLVKVIKNREKEIKEDFWKDLIGPRHTSNLYPFFIEGMYSEQITIKEAAEELENKVVNNIKRKI